MIRKRSSRRRRKSLTILNHTLYIKSDEKELKLQFSEKSIFTYLYNLTITQCYWDKIETT